MEWKAAENARKISQAFCQICEGITRLIFQTFHSGHDSLKDEEGCRRPSAIDNDQLRTIPEADSRKTTREIAEKLNVDY